MIRTVKTRVGQPQELNEYKGAHIAMDEIENKQQLEIVDKVDVLKFLYSAQRDELMYRRERGYKIFTWTSNIFLLLIGALLIAKPSESAIWASYGLLGKAITSITIFVIMAYSIRWQTENRLWHKQNTKILAGIDNILWFHDQQYYSTSGNPTVLPKERMGWGSETINLRTLLFSVNYVSATTLIGILAILMIWFS